MNSTRRVSIRHSIEQVNVICWRERFRDGHRYVHHSLYLQLKVESIGQLGSSGKSRKNVQWEDCADLETVPQAIGWEKNERQRPGSRKVNLSASMNPIHLAETAVGLNLKLMKWRLAPEIDLEILEKTRCLLFGAGTLGCNVARCLMVRTSQLNKLLWLYSIGNCAGLGCETDHFRW